MSDYQEIFPIANQILKKHDLCDNCLGRLFSKRLRLSSNRLLGKKLKKNFKSTQKCHVCKNLFDNLEYFLKLMLDESSGYSFSSFSVGAILKPSIIDRDDQIRSKYRLRGVDGIKTDITKELGKSFSRRTKRLVNFSDPDLTLTVNIKEATCEARSKPVTISGRYVKRQRGMPQRQKACENCSGKGCRACNFHGISKFDSIEGMISKYVFEKLGGTTTRFTWIGGEDKSSLVLGSGRPFFAKINNPLRRDLKPKSKKLDSIILEKLKTVPKSPRQPLKFTSVIEIKISTEARLDSKRLKKLKNPKDNPVVVYEKSGKRSEKKVTVLKYKKTSPHSFVLRIRAEGGLPVKRFVGGDDVSPGISKILGVSCKCREFDFLEILV